MPFHRIPQDELEKIARKEGLDLRDKKFALQMDEIDPLRCFRERFCYPLKQTLPHVRKDLVEVQEGEPCIYLCGNSLGLKPKRTDSLILEQLNKWGEMGVYLHSEEPLPAISCDRYGRDSLGRLVGAKPECVTLMNGLTVNLHLLLISFYQPTEQRFKILIEGQAFPSDRYAFHSQVRLHGLDPESSIIELKEREGEKHLRKEDILKVIEKEGPSISLVCLSGVQYYTGQKFDMKTITKNAQDQGCLVGWDLAHAIGNVELELDHWNVDFACWCTYKYLNSGPGCIAGAYVNSRHAHRKTSQLHGWWSNKEETRFEMEPLCDLADGVDAFRLSNPSPFLVCCALSSLQIFDDAGMDRILAKQFLLTGYLEYLLNAHFTKDPSANGKPFITIITPTDPSERGSQLSLEFSVDLREAHRKLKERGVVCDIRLPSVIRVAPAPLYNSFEDVHKFCSILREIMQSYDAI